MFDSLVQKSNQSPKFASKKKTCCFFHSPLHVADFEYAHLILRIDSPVLEDRYQNLPSYIWTIHQLNKSSFSCTPNLHLDLQVHRRATCVWEDGGHIARGAKTVNLQNSKINLDIQFGAKSSSMRRAVAKWAKQVKYMLILVDWR